MIVIDKLYKLFIYIFIYIKELFCKCEVVKMSAFFDRHGKLIKSNWGDDINYWFLKDIIDGHLISYEWSWRSQRNKSPYVLGIGSIISLFNIDHAVIWGSGIMSASLPIHGYPLDVRAVRGPLTRKYLLAKGIDCPEIYGDPALLLPRYYKPQVAKKYKLGVIPHYVDQNSSFLNSLRKETSVLIIDIRNYEHWLDFIDQICMCDAIASSSLHGLIISAAYGIPNVWMKFEGSKLTDDFKFHDFFLSLNEDRYALIVAECVSSDFLVSKCKKMSLNQLDLDTLIKVCPLKLKNNYEIKA